MIQFQLLSISIETRRPLALSDCGTGRDGEGETLYLCLGLSHDEIDCEEYSFGVDTM